MQKIAFILVFSILAGCGGRYGRNLPEDRGDYVTWVEANALANRIGPEIKRLDPLVGDWNYSETLVPWPGATPETSRGMISFTREYGGRWLVAQIMEDENPDEATATMLLGYSIPQRRYLTAEFGDFSTAALVGEGVEVPSRGGIFAIEFELSMPDPVQNERRILVKRRMEFQGNGNILILDQRSGWNGTLIPFSTWLLTRNNAPAS